MGLKAVAVGFGQGLGVRVTPEAANSLSAASLLTAKNGGRNDRVLFSISHFNLTARQSSRPSLRKDVPLARC